MIVYRSSKDRSKQIRFDPLSVVLSIDLYPQWPLILKKPIVSCQKVILKSSFTSFLVNSHSKTEIVGRSPKSPQFSLFKTKSHLYNSTFLSTVADKVGDAIVEKMFIAVPPLSALLLNNMNRCAHKCIICPPVYQLIIAHKMMMFINMFNKC